ncbi:hypothetical protein [Wolbachia endosymbiont of Litomosoides sigmodontis]|nr:hypothetical protein [Wolbachia endosymbiont of Litomosoides sigmodontis]
MRYTPVVKVPIARNYGVAKYVITPSISTKKCISAIIDGRIEGITPKK